jgi:enterochelin esterase-like enzyme
MRRLIYILLLISSVLVAQTARESVEFNWVNKSEKSIKGAHHHTFYSQANKAEVGFNVYLPEHYQKNSNSRYPVIYVLHGGGGNERSGLTRIRSLELAMKKKIIPPTILVIPMVARARCISIHSMEATWSKR